MAVNTGTTFDRQVARIAVGAYDDAQEVRIAMLNRVRDIVRKRNEDIPFDEVEEEKDSEEQTYDKKYQDENLPQLIDDMLEENKLTSREHTYLETMIDAGGAAAKIEEQYKQVMGITETEPIFTQWLTDVYGVSTILTARLIHKFGYCENFKRVGNLWSYSGLTPEKKRTRGEQADFDPEAKTLGWLVADRIIMQGSNSLYKENFYDPYKEIQVARLERDKEDLCIKCGENPQAGKFTVTSWECKMCGNAGVGDTSALRHQEIMSKERDESHSISFGTDPDTREVSLCIDCAHSIVENGDRIPTPPETQGHADNRARRYLAKKFLKHYWAIGRDIRNLDTPDEWVLAYGGHKKETETFENPFYAKREVMSPD